MTGEILKFRNWTTLLKPVATIAPPYPLVVNLALKCPIRLSFKKMSTFLFVWTIIFREYHFPDDIAGFPPTLKLVNWISPLNTLPYANVGTGSMKAGMRHFGAKSVAFRGFQWEACPSIWGINTLPITMLGVWATTPFVRRRPRTIHGPMKNWLWWPSARQRWLKIVFDI